MIVPEFCRAGRPEPSSNAAPTIAVVSPATFCSDAMEVDVSERGLHTSSKETTATQKSRVRLFCCLIYVVYLVNVSEEF
jgi:hypothetical protein